MDPNVVNTNPLISLSASVVVTEFHIKQGYIEFPANWPVPFNVVSILPGAKPQVGDVLEVNAFAQHN